MINNQKIAKVATFGKKPLSSWNSQYSYSIQLNEGEGVAYLLGAKSKLDSGEVLYALDFDVKNGVGDAFIKEFFELLPSDLESKLHKHYTPSGGLHCLFFAASVELLRCSVLAKSAASLDYPRGVATIEFKGEGGIINVPPSAGYSIVGGFEDIGFLSEEELGVIVNCAKACNKYVAATLKPELPKAVATSITDYWDISPIDAYNAKADVDELLASEGWDFLHQSGNTRHYKHPNKRTRATSATFHVAKRFFYVFSTNTLLPEGKGLSPFALLAWLKFGGDMKKAFASIKNDFGEKKVWRRSAGKVFGGSAGKVLGGSGGKISARKANHTFFVEAGEESPEAESQDALVFWTTSKSGEPSKVNHSLFMKALSVLGFCKFNDTLRKKEGNILKRCELTDIRGEIERVYGSESLVTTITNACIHNYWGSTFYPDLEVIDKRKVIADNRFEAYAFFKSNVVKVTKDGANVMQYNDADFSDKFFLSEKIIDFDYKPTPAGFLSKGEDFINKAIIGGNSEKASVVRDTFGYLTHNYKDEASSYIVVATEQTISEGNGGGAGKDLTFKLLSLLRNSMQLSVSQFKDGRITDELYQPLKGGECMVNLTDLPAHHDIAQYKSIASEDVTVKVLYKNKVTLPAAEAPKLYLSTNYSVQCNDGGVSRRVKYLEFTGFFNQNNTVNEFYGGNFPVKKETLSESYTCWTFEDICGWYDFLFSCQKSWLGNLAKNKSLRTFELSDTGRMKQIRNISESAFSIVEYLYDTQLDYFLSNGFISNAEITGLVDAFVLQEGLKTKPSDVKLAAVFKQFFGAKGVEVISVVKKANGKNQRGKEFKKITGEEVTKEDGKSVKEVSTIVAPIDFAPTPSIEFKPNIAPVSVPPSPQITEPLHPIYSKVLKEIFYNNATDVMTEITERFLIAEVATMYPNDYHFFDYSKFIRFAKSQKLYAQMRVWEAISQTPSKTGVSVCFMLEKE